MHSYHLAQLVDWAGTLETRKRLQKVVYLLQQAGCPLDADFTLHHYGPYSFEVARLTDALVQQGLLDEKESHNFAGRQYSYSLTERAKKALQNAKASPHSSIDEYEGQARKLLQEPDLRKLEYAATISYFYSHVKDWNLALIRAADFKGQQANSLDMNSALVLAKEVAERR